MSSDYIVELSNGFRIVTDSYADNPAGASFVQVLNAAGIEVGYWTYSEWAEEPQLVMGAILGSLNESEIEILMG